MTKKQKAIYLNRLKSFAWRTGMMVLALTISFFLENIDLLSLPPEAKIILGLVLGEVSKYLNTKKNLKNMTDKQLKERIKTKLLEDIDSFVSFEVKPRRKGKIYGTFGKTPRYKYRIAFTAKRKLKEFINEEMEKLEKNGIIIG